MASLNWALALLELAETSSLISLTILFVFGMIVK